MTAARPTGIIKQAGLASSAATRLAGLPSFHLPSRAATRQAVKLALLLAGIVFVHYGFWLNIQLAGVHAETLILAAGLAGVMLGVTRGPVAGFSLGLAHDLVSLTPLGLGALTFTLTSYVMAQAGEAVPARFWWQSSLHGLVGMCLGLLLFAFTGELLGQDFLVTGHFPRVLWVNLIYALVLSPGSWWAFRWATRPGKLNKALELY